MTRTVTVDITQQEGRPHLARRVLAWAPEHVLRNGRHAGRGYLSAEVYAVHTWACGQEMRRSRSDGTCRCGAHALFKRWLEGTRP